MGRPQVKIDVQQFENLCGLQCTQEEIASFFRCSPDTIDRFCKREFNQRFAEVFKEKRGLGCISLRRAQWRLAEKSPAMAIWLGKQYLNQRDNNVITFAPDNNLADAITASAKALDEVADEV